jgi:hypothetical protein
MAFPEPAEVSPWYLRNITQALALNESTGNVYVRTDANVSIENANVTVGNVGITSLGNVDISGNSLPVTGNINILNDVDNSVPISFVPAQSDAFGRLRVSNPLTLFDTQARYFDHGQFVSNITGAATSTYNANSSTFLLAVSSTGDSIIRETIKTFVYQPGKSLLVLNTFAMNTPTADITQRVGYYNTDNGIFFEVNSTTKNMVIRSYSTGSIVEDRIAQSSWNGDKLDGTGPSGITLNPALTQIFWTDIEWLGVGSVRTGFVINGQFIICHTFNHANEAGNINTYMTTACLPIRYELTSTGPAATMRQICSTVISEGGYTLSGTPGSIGHALGTPRRLSNTPSVYTPLISIRLKSTNLDAIVLPVDYTILPEDQALIKFRIYRQAVTSGGSWVSSGSDSSVEYNLAPTSLVSGSVAEEGFLISNNQSASVPQAQSFSFEQQLSRNSFTPVAYEYVITAATTGSNIDVYASLNWQEIS